MSEITEIDKRLVKLLSDVKLDRNFISSVFYAMDTEKKKEEMINYLEFGKKLKMSDVYLKELQINGKIKI